MTDDNLRNESKQELSAQIKAFTENIENTLEEINQRIELLNKEELDVDKAIKDQAKPSNEIENTQEQVNDIVGMSPQNNSEVTSPTPPPADASKSQIGGIPIYDVIGKPIATQDQPLQQPEISTPNPIDEQQISNLGQNTQVEQSTPTQPQQPAQYVAQPNTQQQPSQPVAQPKAQ